MIRTIVIDDESSSIQSLNSIIEDRKEEVIIVGSARSVSEGLELIEKLEPDLVFLDIQMEDGTGFDLLSQCERRDFKVIFVTAYHQYAIEAFRFSAVDYIMKPIDSKELWSAIGKVKEDIHKSKMDFQLSILLDNLDAISKENKKLVLRESDTLHVVRLQEVLWCTADGSYTIFHLSENRKVMVSQHLKEFEDILDNNGFFRVHRSHLVNVNKIRKFDKREGGIIYLEGDVSLPVSVRKREKLLEMLKALL